MKQVYRYDAEGFFVGVELINSEIPSNCTEIKPIDGLFKAKFVNGNWIESMTQNVIDEALNKPNQPTEIELLREQNTELLKRVEEAENAIMMLMDMSLL